MEDIALTLSPQQALDAICHDLRRYGPQTMLCAELLRLIVDDPAAVLREPGHNGLWIRKDRGQQMQFLVYSDLINHLCQIMLSRHFSIDQIAELCRRVFQTNVRIIANGSSPTQLRIATGMESFRCRLCGRCCRDLDYHKEITSADMNRWQIQGREDILKWVGTAKGKGQKVCYQIWIMPGTNRFAEVCPFLKRGAAQNQWVCAIQETKPDICRQYPFTRKHAVMTGCKGFR